jgi:hypothetical protein
VEMPFPIQVAMQDSLLYFRNKNFFPAGVPKVKSDSRIPFVS